MIVAGPQWTESMLRPVGGQDHLGLGSVVTDQVLPSLSPGINVLTPRPRYWSFYAFAIHDFWRQKLPKTQNSLHAHIRKLESMYSVACHLCTNPLHGASAIGSRKVSPLVRNDPPTYRTDFNYMKSPGGGYSLYYATVMAQTGVIRRRDTSLGLPADAVTPDLGVAVAEAFQEAISGTDYFNNFLDAKQVPVDVLREYAEVACLCRLRDPDTPDRAIVAHAILHGGPQSDSATRRTALRLSLEVGSQTDGVALDDELWRRLLLHRSAPNPTAAGSLAFSPPDAMDMIAVAWRVSQLREMFNWSLNGIWQWVHEWGIRNNGDIAPLTQTELFDAIDEIPVRAVTGIQWRTGSAVADLVERIKKAAGVTGHLTGPWKPTGVNEFVLVEASRFNGSTAIEKLAALVALNLLCLARISAAGLSNEAGREVWRLVREGGRQRIGMEFALRQLRRDIVAGATVGDFTRRLVWDLVVTQHQRVALSKLPEDTFRFRVENRDLRFFAQATEFGMNNSRFLSLATMTTELGWCTPLFGDRHQFTDEGDTLRETGDLPHIDTVA